MYCSFDEQKKQTRKINNAVLEYYEDFFTKDGAFDEWQQNSSFRDTMFLINLYLEEDPIKYKPLVDKMLFNTRKDKLENFSTFTPFMSMVTLSRYEEVLSPELKDVLENRILNCMNYNELDSWDFVGVNDNTPAMIMALMILAGERYNNEKWIDLGLERLEQFENMQNDRTFISEFNSPTYHAVTIYAFASLVAFVKNQNIKERALLCEGKLWKTVFTLYHRDTFHIAGPYSRAYMVDSVSQTHQYRMLLYQLMGDELKINPMNTIFRTKEGFEGICWHGTGHPPWFLQFSNCWLANMEYNCPQEYIDDAMNRKYPFFFHGDAQVSASADNHLLESFENEHGIINEDLSSLLLQDDIFEYSAGVTDIFSYITEQYAIGTCTKEWHNGTQTDSFHVVMSKNSPANCQEDISSIFARYIVNNDYGRDELLHDQGRKMAFQYKNTAMVLYSPKTVVQDVNSLKLSILLDNRFDNVSEIVCNGKKLSIGDEEIANKPVFVKFTDVYCAFYPLTGDKEAFIRIENIIKGISISIINYEGETVHFNRKGLKLVPAGFVCEIRNNDEIGSFEDFIKVMSNFQIKDELCANLHTRYAYERKVRYVNNDTLLECSYSPVSEGIRYIRANGKLLEKI